MAIIELDARGQCVFQSVNAEFRHLLQIRGANIIGKPVSAWLREADALAISALLHPEIDRHTLEFDTVVSGPDQHNLPCSLRARSLVGVNPKRVLLTAVNTAPGGMSEQEHLTKQAGVQREDFIATLTHDLKTPIVGANLVLTALLDGTLGPLPPAQANLISKLRTSHQALLKMIQNLLEVYKYESGAQSLRFDGANMADIVKFCLEDVRPLVEHKKIGMDVSCSRDEMLLICDEYAIKRMLINLLGNAVKFTPESGRIAVSAEETDDNVLLTVRDSGRGMTPMERQQLFQRFWQGETGKRYAAGTGLGLYFCYNVVKAHGGSIACDSAVGIGTTFTITLPKHVYAK
jgi:signal transduction histidine kinase